MKVIKLFVGIVLGLAWVVFGLGGLVGLCSIDKGQGLKMFYVSCAFLATSFLIIPAAAALLENFLFSEDRP